MLGPAHQTKGVLAIGVMIGMSQNWGDLDKLECMHGAACPPCARAKLRTKAFAQEQDAQR
eukprot:140780-Pelagomonas_calceolata.AAC.5